MTLKKIVHATVKVTVWPLILHFFPRLAVKIFYRMLFGRFPDFKNPRTFNEKLQLLKVGKYYNDPLVTGCIDKYRVKGLLENHFRAEGLKWAKVYAAFDSVEELFARGFDDYPESFVIKCNHGGGQNFICTDKNKINFAELKKILKEFFDEDYWKKHVEYQYRFIRKKVFVEEFLDNIDNTYKFYCFSGVPKFLYVSNPDKDGNPDVYLDFFDMDFNHLPISLEHHLHSETKIAKPENFDKLRETAKKLAGEFPFVRVDLYGRNGDIYFSEFTFMPTGGYMMLEPPETAEVWGSLLKL